MVNCCVYLAFGHSTGFPRYPLDVLPPKSL